MRGCVYHLYNANSEPLYATSTPDQEAFMVEDSGIETMFVRSQF